MVCRLKSCVFVAHWACAATPSAVVESNGSSLIVSGHTEAPWSWLPQLFGLVEMLNAARLQKLALVADCTSAQW